jgi:aspartyl/asparaginyl beta-hydroxylase (cupin superfamily)
MYVFCQKAKQFYHEPWNNWASIIAASFRGCSDSFIEVAGEERRWRNGEMLAFDDSCDHSARHDGEEAG